MLRDTIETKLQEVLFEVAGLEDKLDYHTTWESLGIDLNDSDFMYALEEKFGRELEPFGASTIGDFILLLEEF